MGPQSSESPQHPHLLLCAGAEGQARESQSGWCPCSVFDLQVLSGGCHGVVGRWVQHMTSCVTLRWEETPWALWLVPCSYWVTAACGREEMPRNPRLAPVMEASAERWTSTLLAWCALLPLTPMESIFIPDPSLWSAFLDRMHGKCSILMGKGYGQQSACGEITGMAVDSGDQSSDFQVT